MGWSFNCHRSDKATFVAELLSPQHWGPAYRILDHAVVGNHLWSAIECTDEHPTYPGDRFICLHLLKSDRGCWGYKDMTESCGPYAYDCPLRLLDLVPPLKEDRYGWREKCRAWHAARAAARKARAALKPGTRVVYAARTYTLDYPMGRKGWAVTRDDGTPMRMKATQLSAAVAA